MINGIEILMIFFAYMIMRKKKHAHNDLIHNEIDKRVVISKSTLKTVLYLAIMACVYLYMTNSSYQNITNSFRIMIFIAFIKSIKYQTNPKFVSNDLGYSITILCILQLIYQNIIEVKNINIAYIYIFILSILNLLLKLHHTSGLIDDFFITTLSFYFLR